MEVTIKPHFIQQTEWRKNYVWFTGQSVTLWNNTISYKLSSYETVTLDLQTVYAISFCVFLKDDTSGYVSFYSEVYWIYL